MESDQWYLCHKADNWRTRASEQTDLLNFPFIQIDSAMHRVFTPRADEAHDASTVTLRTEGVQDVAGL